MRELPQIAELWQKGGAFVGSSGKPHTRVTVQLPWSDLSGGHKYDFLRVEDVDTGLQAWRGHPLRWFQKGDNSQEELEIQGVKDIQWSRSIDQDAGTCDITIYNTTMFDNDASDGSTITGQPGYYTPNRGSSPEARARWGHEENDWKNLLSPNALIRNYFGYGGTDKSIEDALDDGNIALVGVWLVDTVEIGTDGTMSLHCRDTMKLLIDQQLYLPLIPRFKYPLRYYRWQYYSEDVRASARTVTSTDSTKLTPGDKHYTFSGSDVDAWYPNTGAGVGVGSPGDEIGSGGFSLHGHRAADAFDGNPDTFYLSVGNSRPDAAFAYSYLQVDVGEGINSVYVHPWAGNYQMFVSVMENGAWQGSDTIPYSDAELVGTQPYWVDTGAAIPYVGVYNVPWETPLEYILPRAYHAQKVRITFHNLAYTDYGPWHYRAGVREFRVRVTQGGSTSFSTTTTTVLQPLFLAGGSLTTEAYSGPNAQGFLTADTNFQVDAFGDARVEAVNHGGTNNHVVTAVRPTPSGLGYYVLDSGGHVNCYGDAVWQGQPNDDGYLPPGFGRWPHEVTFDMALTPSGNGYWVLRTDGHIYSYGDAATYSALPDLGESQLYTSIESHPSVMGVWVAQTDGTVTNLGSASHYGNFSPLVPNTRSCTCIRSSLTGDGYWLLDSGGNIQNKGGAPSYGHPDPDDPNGTDWGKAYWELMVTGAGDGYWVLKGDGHVYAFGNAMEFGSPLPGTKAQLRKAGNYTDWSDIIKDLGFWSGFLRLNPDQSPYEEPDFLGVIETTGSYSDEDLPDDLFDKRPVIDPIHEIKEAVGYVIGATYYGGFFFRSPNWWKPGNFNQDAEHVDFMFELDENTTLIDYHVTSSDDPLRSTIIISSEDPGPFAQEKGDAAKPIAGTVTTRFIPATKRVLRGLVKPAMWVNSYFQNKREQKVMAELIALHSWFQTRIGQITCPLNPAIEIDDQVRIWESLSSESYIHYVRGIECAHDLDSGSATMTLTTHWLGDENQWAVDDSGEDPSEDADSPDLVFPISSELSLYVKKRMGSASNSGVGIPQEPITEKSVVVEGTTDNAGPE